MNYSVLDSFNHKKIKGKHDERVCVTKRKRVSDLHDIFSGYLLLRYQQDVIHVIVWFLRKYRNRFYTLTARQNGEHHVTVNREPLVDSSSLCVIKRRFSSIPIHKRMTSCYIPHSFVFPSHFPRKLYKDKLDNDNGGTAQFSRARFAIV